MNEITTNLNKKKEDGKDVLGQSVNAPGIIGKENFSKNTLTKM